MSNRLAILAEEIRRAHGGVRDAAKMAVKRAIEAGAALIEAKSLLKHGEWLPWLEDNCAVSERTARLYISLAKNREQIEHEIGNVADLTLRAALALIASPKSRIVEHVADVATNMFDFIAFEKGIGERDIRREAFTFIQGALDKLQGAETPGLCQLCEQLISAIENCTGALNADLSTEANAAILKAKDLSVEMLRHAGAST